MAETPESPGDAIQRPGDVGPVDVVEAVLEAGRRSSAQAARLLWELGADKLRRMAGDRVHLERLLVNELFSPLIEHRRVELEPLEQIDDSARQTVTTFSGGGETARFLISLKRSAQGERAGQWLITGIEREW